MSGIGGESFSAEVVFVGFLVTAAREAASTNTRYWKYRVAVVNPPPPHGALRPLELVCRRNLEA